MRIIVEDKNSFSEPLLVPSGRRSSSPLRGAWVQEMSPLRAIRGVIDGDGVNNNSFNHPIVSYKNAFRKVVIELTLPYAFALFLAIGGDFLVSAILSQVDKDRLAASALVGAVSSLLLVPLSSMLTSVCMLTGDEKSKPDPVNVGKLYRQGLFFSLILSIPLVALTGFAVEPALVGLNQPRDLSHIAQNFFHGRALGFPFTMLSEVNQQLALGVLKPRLPAAIVISNTALTAGLGYVLTLGKFGITPLNELGLGYAMSIAAFINFIASTIYLKFSKDFRAYNLFSFQCKDYRGFCELIKYGAPVGAQTFVEIASLAIPSLFIGWLSRSSLVAQQTVIPYYGLLLSPYLATSRVIVGLIGETNRQNQPYNVARYTNAAIVFGWLVALTGLMLFSSAPKPLASFFINVNDPANSETMSLAKSLFIVHGCELIVDSTRNILTGALRGLKDPYSPSLVTLLTTSLCIGLGYALGFPANLGVVGIYIGRDLGLFAGAVILGILWMRRDKLPSVIEAQNAALSQASGAEYIQRSALPRLFRERVSDERRLSSQHHLSFSKTTRW